MTGVDSARIGCVVRKELREYRRKRSIVVGMAVLPAIFLIEPTLAVFLGAPGSPDDPLYSLPLLLLLLIPVFMPATLAAYTVVGEREQGTLEPLLTTPIRRKEFILGKAAAVMLPTLVLSYAVFGVFLGVVRLFASAITASAVFHQGPVLLALFLFTPLLAGWAIVVGMAVSVRVNEVRVAQQIGTVASFPPLIVVVLMGLGVIQPTFTVAIVFAIVLLFIDVQALRFISRMFDRERLVTGTRAS
jgi:ABC-2 type transport system permease protein